MRGDVDEQKIDSRRPGRALVGSMQLWNDLDALAAPEQPEPTAIVTNPQIVKRNPLFGRQPAVAEDLDDIPGKAGASEDV